MGNKILRSMLVLSFFIFSLLYCTTWAYGEIIAKPGNFDHFQIHAPDVLIAGNEYKIVIYAVDRFGNPVSMPSDSVKEYKLTVRGSAVVSPSKFKSNEITQSGLIINFKDEKAEEVVLVLYEINSPFPVVEKKIKILPAEISGLNIKVPPTVRVGNEFEVLISGYDRFGNNVCKDFNPKELNLFFKGEVSPQIKDIQYFSDSCLVKVKLFSEKIGVFHIEADLLDKKVTGKSNRVEVLNGTVNSFIINAPEEAVVDEPFEITILAIDKFNNFVKDFAAQREKIVIEAQGKGYIFPSELTSYAFSEGKARLTIRYDKPEEIRIVAKLASNNAVRGESNPIKIVPPKVKRFEVISPDTIIAGQKFKVKIIAYNHLDKLMSNYNLYGNTVVLKSSGSGTLTPNRVPPSEFVNGIATVELMYDKAEKFEIFATVEEKEVPSKEVKIIEEQKVEKPKKKVVRKKDSKEVKSKKKGSFAKAQTLELKNVSIVETKNASTLTLFIPNIDKHGGYHPITKKAGSSMSVILEVYPVKNKLETPLKIDSEFIKDVSVSEEQNKVVLNITLKRPLKYRVVKKKDELLIEFRRS
ncbi:MAG: hypothetical protein NZ845_00065 [Thermodesulfovibrio sp.]|nr:hypothetical protein [Thermodesulfovibrio sp.]MCX7724450.1 hypothetical protein [Thermodesulfovibrio sp.]MDW7972177.1 hypothetical protein [Thermodesulfovibrio sp.]